MNDEEYREENTADAARGAGRLLRRISGRALDDVRIHDSEQAGRLARRLGARAFTAGRDVYIRPELVSPMTLEGSAVLAHELWHVAEHDGASGNEMPLVHGRATANEPGRAASDAAFPVQRAISPGLSASETRAEAVETAVRQTGEREPRRQEPPEQEPLDPYEIAERVYNLMMQDLIIDAERGVRG